RPPSYPRRRSSPTRRGPASNLLQKEHVPFLFLKPTRWTTRALTYFAFAARASRYRSRAHAKYVNPLGFSLSDPANAFSVFSARSRYFSSPVLTHRRTKLPAAT